VPGAATDRPRTFGQLLRRRARAFILRCAAEFSRISNALRATILLLMICLPLLATLAAWSRSYAAEDRHAWQVLQGTASETVITVRGVTSTKGRIEYRLWETTLFGPPLSTAPRPRNSGSLWANELAGLDPQRIGQNKSVWNKLGFAWRFQPAVRASFTHANRYAVVAIPYWSLALLAATPLVLVAAKLSVRRRRARSCACVRCGYDLRATAGKCPECGAERSGRSQLTTS
jgi:hypothetical protein